MYVTTIKGSDDLYEIQTLTFKLSSDIALTSVAKFSRQAVFRSREKILVLINILHERESQFLSL